MADGTVETTVKFEASGHSVPFTWSAGVLLTVAGAMTKLDCPTVSSAQLVEDSFPLRSPGDVAEVFRQHVAAWKAEMRASASSSLARMVANPNYQRIIGMGRPAVPYLLAELEARPDHWMWALEMITGENPVPPEHVGRLGAMASAWMEWGRARRLV